MRERGEFVAMRGSAIEAEQCACLLIRGVAQAQMQREGRAAAYGG